LGLTLNLFIDGESCFKAVHRSISSSLVIAFLSPRGEGRLGLETDVQCLFISKESIEKTYKEYKESLVPQPIGRLRIRSCVWSDRLLLFEEMTDDFISLCFLSEISIEMEEEVNVVAVAGGGGDDAVAEGDMRAGVAESFGAPSAAALDIAGTPGTAASVGSTPLVVAAAAGLSLYPLGSGNTSRLAFRHVEKLGTPVA